MGDCADTELPRDEGKWCSTLVSGDDTSDTKVYAVGPVGEKAVSNVTVSRPRFRAAHARPAGGVADGNVGAPRPLTTEELTTTSSSPGT